MIYQIDMNEEAEALLYHAKQLYTHNTWEKMMKLYEGNPLQKAQSVIVNTREPSRKTPIKKKVYQDMDLLSLHDRYSIQLKRYNTLIHSFNLHDEIDCSNIILTFSDKELESDQDNQTVMRLLANKQQDIIAKLFDKEIELALSDARKKLDFDTITLIKAMDDVKYMEAKTRLIGIIQGPYYILHKIKKMYEILAKSPAHDAKYLKISLIY